MVLPDVRTLATARYEWGGRCRVGGEKKRTGHKSETVSGPPLELGLDMFQTDAEMMVIWRDLSNLTKIHDLGNRSRSVVVVVYYW